MNPGSSFDDRIRPLPGANETAPPGASPVARADVREHGGIRRLIWIYFWLLILEGALRKWFLPGLANPLLVIRDPFLILIYVLALTGRIFPWNGFVISAGILGVLSAFASLYAEHGNHFVTLYGLRTNFLFLPLIYIIPKVFDLRDVEKVGKWLLIVALPMAVLVAIQFRSSPGAWVNVGVGAGEGAQLGVGFGRIRPPGTFSFTNGLGIFLSLVSAFIMSWQLRRGSIPAWLAYAAIPATGLMIAISGSRSVLSSFVVILAGMLYVCVRRGAFFGKGVRAGILIAVAFCALLLVTDFRRGMIVHEYRLSGGGGVRVGLIGRTLGGFLEPIRALRDAPFFGSGIGMGTGVGAGLLKGERSFLLAETEWLRVVLESGPVLGLAYLALRIAIVIFIGLRANRALADDYPLPMILFAAVFPIMLTGQFGVPTVLGFAVFGAGLCLASTNIPHAPSDGPSGPDLKPVPEPVQRTRGRSIYAEKLHGP